MPEGAVSDIVSELMDKYDIPKAELIFDSEGKFIRQDIFE